MSVTICDVTLAFNVAALLLSGIALFLAWYDKQKASTILLALSLVFQSVVTLGHRAHPFLIRGVCQLSGNPRIKWELIIFLCGGFGLRLFFRGENLAMAEGDWQIQAHFPGAGSLHHRTNGQSRY